MSPPGREETGRGPGGRLRPGATAGCLLLVWGLAAAACGVRGLSFVQDDRVEIVSPPDRAEVSLPVTVEWEVTDFDVTGRTGSADRDAGFFGVFVDRAPQPPGETLAWLAEDDEVCRTTAGCPDEGYFAGKGAFTTAETEFTVERLPRLAGEEEGRQVFHEVIVVLLNGRGERIGESAFAVEFRLTGRDS